VRFCRASKRGRTGEWFRPEPARHDRHQQAQGSNMSPRDEKTAVTTNDLFDRLTSVLADEPGVLIAGYVCPGLYESEVDVRLTADGASPDELDTAVLAAKGHLNRFFADGISAEGTGPYPEEAADLVRQLATMGVFVFAVIVPYEREEDQIVLWSRPDGDGEVLNDPAQKVQSILTLDGALSDRWRDLSEEDRACTIETNRFDPVWSAVPA